MSNGPIALSLNWNPFGDRTASKRVIGDLLDLGGIAASALKLGSAPDNVSLSPTGKIYDKTVVSEVTTITVHANSAYTVETESPDQAARDKASGTALASASGADGNVNVVAADTSNAWNNTGSIGVETTITYSDGSAQKSTASLSSTFITSGDGLARKRLDSLVGGSASESEIIAKLGIAQPDSAAADAANAPTDVGVDATVSTDLNVSLTYTSLGGQRSVSGVESGSGNALITTFDPAQLTYGPNGVLSNTKESMSFTGTINGGSLSRAGSVAWLGGTVSESTKAVTTIPGPNGITISRQSTAAAEFGTSPTSSLVASQSSNAAQISFAGVVDTAAGLENERITLSASNSSSASQVSDADGTTSRSSQHIGDTSVSFSWTPIEATPALVITNQALAA